MLAPARNRARDPMQKAAQYTALVDILFATIGIFVIVFALQELETPVELKPARYDGLILCGPDRMVTLHHHDIETRQFRADQIEGPLAAAIGGGRYLMGISAECATEREGIVPVNLLMGMEQELSERDANGTDALTLFEFAPIGTDEFDSASLLERFAASAETAR